MELEVITDACQDLGLLNLLIWLALLELHVDALLESNALAEDTDLLVFLPSLRTLEEPLRSAKSINILYHSF